MNQLYVDIAGSVVRVVLAVASAMGLISENDVDQYAGAILLVGVAVWGVVQKIRAKREFMTAAALSHPVSHAQVKQYIANGFSAPAKTPSTQVPVIGGQVPR